MIAEALQAARTAWLWLRGVPAWVWAVLSLCVALLSLWGLRKGRAKSQILIAERAAVQKYVASVDAARGKRKAALQEAKETYQRKLAAIEERDRKLDAVSGDTDKVTDAVNDAFGGDK